MIARAENLTKNTSTGPLSKLVEWFKRLIKHDEPDDDTPDSFRRIAQGKDTTGGGY